MARLRASDPLPDAPDDGLYDRDARRWSEVKLRILRCYIWGFVRATKTARRRYYVDGLVGPGVNRLRDSGRRVPGSPLLALEMSPAFTRCLLMEFGAKAAEALQARVHQYGERVVARQGDCNHDLVPLVRDQVEPWAPCLCVLDPEGEELAWETVAAIARLRPDGARRIEQLILFPVDMGFVRDLQRDGVGAEASVRITRMFGNERWREVYELRARDEITAEEARTAYVQLYASGLRDELGYRHVIDRQIRTDGDRGRPLYFLLFATDSDVGLKIMDHCFNLDPEDAGRLFSVDRVRRIRPR